jgi:hypothetical protein
MVLRRINGCLAAKDNHDSWEMCTTSTECRTIMAVVLMVMSGTDPHTIRVTWVGMVGMLGVDQSHQLGQATIVDSVVCLMSRLKEKIGISHSSLA